MTIEIKRVAVVGSGVMGAQIAAQVAGCGIPVYLFDIVPNGAADRSQLAKEGIKQLLKSNPPAFYEKSDLSLISPANLEDDLPKLSDCDWIVEAVVEKLEIKEALFKKIEPFLKKEVIVTSNTSGILLADLVEGRASWLKSRFLITHFFNPVRYLKLVELVALKDTSLEVLSFMSNFLERGLGKGVVRAKDTPNFIANRIGVFSVMQAILSVAENGWPIEAVDAVMGKAIGRPKSAIFRTADVVGLDTLAHVARNTFEKCRHDEARDVFLLPEYFQKMIDQKWLGDKGGQGFYKKQVTEAGKEILAIDPSDLSYHTQSKFKANSLKAAKSQERLSDRLRSIVFADDEAGHIAWKLVSHELVYAANRLGEISDDHQNIDLAMRWGFGWELGPFELWDQLGLKEVAERLEAEDRAVPAIVQDKLKGNAPQFYPKGRLAVESKHYPIVKKNNGASLLDLGDGVLACSFHTKMNAIDADVIEMLGEAVGEVEKNHRALVIGHDGENFSVGANLMLVWMAAQAKQWQQIDDMVKTFQAASMKLSSCKKPVVAAPFGMTLGGGCEIALSAHHICAAMESYIGLVEVGVGLIPAGGGCKNMIIRMEERHRANRQAKDNIWFSPEDGGPFPKVREAFETIAMAKVSISARDARSIGYLRASDECVISRALLMESAKKRALEMSSDFQPRESRTDIQLPGVGGWMALLNAVNDLKQKGLVTAHDEVVVSKLAYVLSGGNRPNLHMATEADMLDLEREAFLSLCGMEATQARMQHMLMTGKPLRN